MDISDHEQLDEITDYVTEMRDQNTFVPSDATFMDTFRFQQEQNQKGPRLAYLVVDTNFILTHLSVLDGLEQLLHGPCVGAYQIVIPKQVVHELDGLKESNRAFSNTPGSGSRYDSQHSISTLARRAIDWCYAHFHDSLPTVTGQRLHERIDRNASKDNAILDCCLYFQNVENGGGNLSVLLSDDKNLCVKALVNNVLTVSFRPGMTAELIAANVLSELEYINNGGCPMNTNGLSNTTQIVNQSQYREQEVDENTSQPQSNQLLYNDGNIATEEMMTDTYQEDPPARGIAETKADDGSPEKTFSTIYRQVTSVVLEAVNFAVNYIHEEDIYMIDYDGSKISGLRDAAKCIVRLGFSTFSDFFDRRNTFNPMKILGDATQFHKYTAQPRTVDELKEFLTFWTDFLDGIYKSRAEEQRQALEQLEQLWKNKIKAIS